MAESRTLYFRNSKNLLDFFTTFILFGVGLVLRIPYAAVQMWETGTEVTRVLYGLALTCSYIRVLYNFSVNPQLGPKLRMIWKMVLSLNNVFSCILKDNAYELKS